MANITIPFPVWDAIMRLNQGIRALRARGLAMGLSMAELPWEMVPRQLRWSEHQSQEGAVIKVWAWMPGHRVTITMVAGELAETDVRWKVSLMDEGYQALKWGGRLTDEAAESILQPLATAAAARSADWAAWQEELASPVWQAILNPPIHTQSAEIAVRDYGKISEED